MALPAIPLLWEPLNTNYSMSIVRAKSLTTNSGRLFNYLYLGVNKLINTCKECSGGPARISVGAGSGPSVAQFSDPQAQQPHYLLTSEGSPPTVTFPAQCGCTAWGYSTLWPCRIQFCSLPTPFLHSHYSKHSCIKKQNYVKL